MKLIDNLRNAGKLWTIKWSLLLILANLAVSLLSVYIQPHVSVTSYAVIMAATSAVTMVLRVISQTPKPPT